MQSLYPHDMSSPGFFITSFISAPIPMTQKPVTSQLNGVKFGMHPLRTLSPGQSISNSLLGQPPSPPGEQTNEGTSAVVTDYVEGFEEQPLDVAVASIYASTPQDPLSYIMEEKIDDKEIMLMHGKLRISVSIKQVMPSTKLLSRSLCGLSGYLLLAPVS